MGKLSNQNQKYNSWCWTRELIPAHRKCNPCWPFSRTRMTRALTAQQQANTESTRTEKAPTWILWQNKIALQWNLRMHLQSLRRLSAGSTWHGDVPYRQNQNGLSQHDLSQAILWQNRMASCALVSIVAHEQMQIPGGGIVNVMGIQELYGTFV